MLAEALGGVPKSTQMRGDFRRGGVTRCDVRQWCGTDRRGGPSAKIR